MDTETTQRRTSHSVPRDIAISLAWASVAFGVWATAWWFGPSTCTATTLPADAIQLCAAALTVASLLSRQYLQTEVVAYMKSLRDVNACLDTAQLLEATHDVHVPDVAESATIFGRHRRYVQEELKVLGALPVVMITAFGVAVFAAAPLLIGAAVYSLLAMVMYMVRCSVTAVDVSMERLELDDIVREFGPRLKAERQALERGQR